jgi:hypothetical protein
MTVEHWMEFLSKQNKNAQVILKHDEDKLSIKSVVVPVGVRWPLPEEQVIVSLTTSFVNEEKL